MRCPRATRRAESTRLHVFSSTRNTIHMQLQHLWGCSVGSRSRVSSSTDIWQRESWNCHLVPQKPPLMTRSPGRDGEASDENTAGGLINTECWISRSHTPPPNELHRGFGKPPIRSLARRSVVSEVAHACPVRSNLLAACREMGLIKSLTEISPTRV